MQTIPPPLDSDDARLNADSDAALLRRYAERRDSKAFETLVERHASMVRAVARRMAGEGAEDVAQVVFAELARRAAGLAQVTSLGAWLHRVAAVQSQRFARQQARSRNKHEAYAVEMNTTTAVAPEADALNEALPVLDAALEDLSDKDRELIFLRYYERTSFKSLADRLGRNEAALRQQAGRAVERLSTALKRRGAAVSTTALAAGLSGVLAPVSSATATLMSVATLAAGARLAATSLPASTTVTTTWATLSSTVKVAVSSAVAALVVAVPIIQQELAFDPPPSSTSVSVTPESRQKGSAAEKGAANELTASPSPEAAEAKQEASPDELSPLEQQLFMRIISTAGEQHALAVAAGLGWSEERRQAFATFIQQGIINPSMREDEGSQMGGVKEMKAMAHEFVRKRFGEAEAQAYEAWMRAQETSLAEAAAERELSRFNAVVDLSDAQKEALFQALANSALAVTKEGFNPSTRWGAHVGSTRPAMHEDPELLATVLTPEQLRLLMASQKVTRDTAGSLKPIMLQSLITKFPQVAEERRKLRAQAAPQPTKDQP